MQLQWLGDVIGEVFSMQTTVGHEAELEGD